MPGMIALVEMLARLRSEYGVTLHTNNLTAKRNDSAQSVMAEMATLGLAQGQGSGGDSRPRRWLVADTPEATDFLLAQVKGGRRGPGPGQRATLDAVQINRLVAALAATADPAGHISDGLAVATGWLPEVVAAVEYVIVPVTPRRPPPLFPESEKPRP